MATVLVFRIVMVCALLIITTSSSSRVFAATNNISSGFTIDLIHRDSPNSPFYNPLETQADRLQKSVQRFFKRINNSSPSDSITIDLYLDGIDYLANLTIGTPPVQFIALVDTGSSITWTQCLPCERCFSQYTPIFDPKLSSSYKHAECGSPACALLSQGRCGSGGQSGVCTYGVNYVDESYTKGLLSSETFTLGGSVTIENLVFGCGTNNSDTSSSTFSGILGLGNEPTSLISQLSPFIKGRFSYCLVPSGMFLSKMKFGTHALVTGDGVISTQLVLKPNLPGYFVTLQAVGVGSEIFELTTSTNEGNLLVDTGTVYTCLPINLYHKVADSLARQLQKPIVDDPLESFKHYFAIATKDDITDPPHVTLYFPGGGLKLGTQSFLTRINEDVVCFSFFPDDRYTVFGVGTQVDVWVGIDIEAKTFNFVSADCSMH